MSNIRGLGTISQPSKFKVSDYTFCCYTACKVTER